jgi:hypothetical protein
MNNTCIIPVVLIHCQKNARKTPCSAACDSGAKANDTDFSVLIYYYDETDFSVGGRKIPCENTNFPRWLWIDPFSFSVLLNGLFRWQKIS